MGGPTSPLLSALYNGDRAQAEALAARRELDIFEAAAMSQAARIESLVAADPALADRKAPDGFTALHLNAFFSGDFATARLLLDAGANLDAVADNETQVRLINSAAAAGSNHLVALLIERGADIEARSGAVTRRFIPLRRTGITS
jgi:ankyrin repeat protein